VTALFEIRAPADQSEGTRSQILRWLKVIGDAVVVNEPLIELETDKVTVEIPAPVSGVLKEISKGEGDEVVPDDLLGKIELAGGAADTPPAVARHAPAPAATGTPARTQPSAATREQLSPAVRRLLAEHGIDASQVSASGQGGRITAEDVLKAAAARPGRAPAAMVPAAAVPDAPPVARRILHSAMRKRIAAHMLQSLTSAPHVTSVFEADMSAVSAHRLKHHAGFENRGVALTLTAYFVAATVAAVRAVPEVNSRWTDEALEIYDTINVGVAAALEGGGLLVPVLRAVESCDLFAIAQGLQRLVTRARAGELAPADVRGGTITISNHGTSGSILAAPIIINQPQSAILGIGKLEKRATVIEEAGLERIVVRRKCYVTLTIDHRVLDGRDANRFLQAYVQELESWHA
jgi:2-oxoglutarate dehydrogenase E2 component (dihydrolipoamide succinyltransferase)